MLTWVIRVVVPTKKKKIFPVPRVSASTGGRFLSAEPNTQHKATQAIIYHGKLRRNSYIICAREVFCFFWLLRRPQLYIELRQQIIFARSRLSSAHIIQYKIDQKSNRATPTGGRGQHARRHLPASQPSATPLDARAKEAKKQERGARDIALVKQRQKSSAQNTNFFYTPVL